jgi:hypothetical protein
MVREAEDAEKLPLEINNTILILVFQLISLILFSEREVTANTSYEKFRNQLQLS